MTEAVNHPDHYGGDSDYEVIKVLEAWNLQLAQGFCWGNLIKYTARAGKKGGVHEVEDRQKAQWYADRLTTITARLDVQEAKAKAEVKRTRYFTDPQGNPNFETPDGAVWAKLPGSGWQQVLKGRPETTTWPVPDTDKELVDGTWRLNDEAKPAVDSEWIWRRNARIRVTSLEGTNVVWCRVIEGSKASGDTWWTGLESFRDNARMPLRDHGLEIARV